MYIHTSLPINTGINSDEIDDKDDPIPSKHVEHSTQQEQDEASKHKALQQKGCIPPNDNVNFINYKRRIFKNSYSIRTSQKGISTKENQIENQYMTSVDN
jgi:hypothetical protein